MHIGAKRPVGTAQSHAVPNTTWARTKAILKHNSEVGDKVLWCLGVDWQRTRPKFQGYRGIDLNRKLFTADKTIFLKSVGTFPIKK